MLHATHAGRLERWLGTETVEQLSASMRDWYGPPIAVHNVPGAVWAHKGGDFSGPLKAGHASHLLDFAEQRAKRIWRNFSQRQALQANAGFSSLSDLIMEATTGGKKRIFPFNKAGATGVVAVTNSLWGLGPHPAAGANASAAPGGDAPTDATTGAFLFTNPTGGDTQHFTTGYSAASVISNTLMLYDRLFQVNKTMASTATEAVSGVPTRYQSTTASNPDYVGGNFLFVEVGGTALAGTNHNWTVCLYTDQGGASSTLPSLTGVNGAIVRRLDQIASQWFAPLASGDVGIQTLTQMQCDASVATGVINFVIGHPIAIMPHPVVNLLFVADGINTAFNLTRIFDDAALGFLELVKPATGSTNYTGMFETVAG
jgi:hypothetical protein